MNRSGPVLETLTRRLAETPPDFLDEPRIGERGVVFVPALVHDLLRSHGVRASLELLQRFQGRENKADRNRLALAMIVVWLLSQEWFARAKPAEKALLEVLTEMVAELAHATAAHKFTSDADRREELARLLLARLDYRPEGESIAQATDRLTALSVTERKRLLDASRAAEKRAREVRAALVKKAAEESADKWSRE